LTALYEGENMQKIYIAIVLSIAFIGCAQTSGTGLVTNKIPPKKTFVIKESKNVDKSDERYDDYYYGNCRFYHCHIMHPFFKTTKSDFLIPPTYDTCCNSFAALESKFLVQSSN
jgi:hypothetical protein